jgi:hypothetical protein
MLERQAEQNDGIVNSGVFATYIGADSEEGGFSWGLTPEKNHFWGSVICEGNFELFYEKYPKKEPEIMNSIKFNTVKAMVSWLIDNENKVLSDGFGREWSYHRSQFFFMDIGDKYPISGRLECLHLYGTELKILN